MKPTRHIVKPSGFWKPTRSPWYQKNDDGGTAIHHWFKKQEARKLKLKWTREGGLSGSERERLRELADEGYTSGDDD